MDLLLAVKKFLVESGYRGTTSWEHGPTIKSVSVERTGEPVHQVGIIPFAELAKMYDAEVTKLGENVINAHKQEKSKECGNKELLGNAVHCSYCNGEVELTVEVGGYVINSICLGPETLQALGSYIRRVVKG